MNLRAIFPNGTGNFESPVDFTATFASTNSLALTDLKFDITQGGQVKQIIMVNKTDHTATIYRLGENGVSFEYSGGILVMYGQGTPFVDGYEYIVSVSGQLKGYDRSSGVMLFHQTNAKQDHYTSIETTTYASTNNTTAFYQEISMDSFKNLYLQLIGTSITFTIEASGDGIKWDDVSTLILGAASFVTTTAASDSFFVVDMMPLKFRIVCTPTNATNATTINLRRY